jgi:hypothetical protein
MSYAISPNFANRHHHDTNPAYLTQRINDAELLDLHGAR